MDRLAIVAAGMVGALGVAPMVPWPLEAAAVALLAWLVSRGRADLLAGAAIGWAVVASLPVGPALEGHLVVEGVVVGAPTGRSADVAVSRWARVSGPWTPAAGRVRVRFPDGTPPPGTGVRVQGLAEAPWGPALPGDPDPVRNAARSRVRTVVKARTAAVLDPGPPRRDAFGGLPHGPVLRALATGDRDEVAQDTWTLLRRTGTSHVLSISGFHVGLVALIFGGGARWALRAVAVIRPRGVSTAPAWALAALTGAVYAWSAGAPASAQRAAWMVALGAVAHATGREVRPLALLGGACIAVLVVDPAAVGTAGFQLSFGAILGLVRVTPWLLRMVPPDPPRGLGWIVNGTATTIGATVGTLPAAAWWFQELAPSSPFANLVALPWVTFAVVPCAVGAVVLPSPLAEASAWGGDRALAVLFAVLERLATEPWTPAVGPVGALVLAAVLVWPRREVVVAAAAIALLTAREPRPDGLVVTFLDVGQGDAALVEFPDGRRWLVDGGPPGDRVLRYLRRRGVRHLDVVVASHGHPDHTGGLEPVLAGLHVGELWVPSTEGVQRLLTVAWGRGVRVRIGPPWARHPWPGFRGRGVNDRSLVLVAAWGEREVLFPGDVEREAEAALLDRVGPVDVLKAPHHGSRTSSAPALLDALRPAVAVVSAGRRNFYGHPDPEVLARYAERGVDVWRTDRDGTVEVTLGEEVVVRSWKAGDGWSDRAITPLAWVPASYAAGAAPPGTP